MQLTTKKRTNFNARFLGRNELAQVGNERAQDQNRFAKRHFGFVTGFVLVQVLLGCQSSRNVDTTTGHDALNGASNVVLDGAQLSSSEKTHLVGRTAKGAETTEAESESNSGTDKYANQSVLVSGKGNIEISQESIPVASHKTLSRQTRQTQDTDTPEEPLGFDDDKLAQNNDAEDAAVVEELPKDTERDELDADSAKSPEELARLIQQSELGGGIEGSFALCEGSIYMLEWQRNFDSRWLASNGARFKKASLQKRALNEARSAEFLTLLFPALNTLNFDYPVVITDDVIKWVQYFQTRGRKAFVTWLRRAEDVMPQIRPVLEKYGLPQDLVYLAMIESGFNNRALSIARAAGPWQFMRATGKMYGLKINDYVDERRDPAKSTEAAAAYLTNLYTMFGDWHLAAASYNAGEGRIMRARRGVEQNDFISLAEAGRLPNETRNYVPKLIAAMIISKNPSKFGFEVAEGSRAMRTKNIRVERSIALVDLAKELEIDLKVLENLNPELRLGITPPATSKTTAYELHVPEKYAMAAVAALDKLPTPSTLQRVAAKVRRKESVAQFAHRYGITVSTLLTANPTVRSNSKLRLGQTLVVPVALGSGQYEKLTTEGKSKKHRLQADRKAGRKGSRIASRRLSRKARTSR